MLNVFQGGDLYQDIYRDFEGLPRLRTPLPLKRVSLEPDSQLRRITGDETLLVNAIHHQSVRRLGEGGAVAGRDEYGVVQAIEFAGKAFRIGVQWHPELLFYRRAHRKLFAAFVTAARRIRDCDRT